MILAIYDVQHTVKPYALASYDVSMYLEKLWRAILDNQINKPLDAGPVPNFNPAREWAVSERHSTGVTW